MTVNIKRTSCLFLIVLLLPVLLFGCTGDEPASDTSVQTSSTTGETAVSVSAESTDSTATQADATVLYSTTSAPTHSDNDDNGDGDEEVPRTQAQTTENRTSEYSLSSLEIVDTSSSKYSYNQLVTDINELCAAYPELLSYEVIGQSVDGRSIYCMRLGGKNTTGSIIVQGAMHGREHMNITLLMAMTECYLKYYNEGEYEGRRYSDIFNTTAVYIVPSSNPDGVAISQYGLDGINSEALKTRIREIYESDTAYGYTERDFSTYLKKWKSNANGVDINRNFDKDFGARVKRETFSFGEYQGEYANSEPETQCLTNLVASVPNLRGALSYHSYGQMLYWDYAQSGSLQSKCKGLAQRVRSLTGYKMLGAEEITFYGCFGDILIDKGLPNLTVETGGVDTPLPYSQFGSIFTENRNVIVAAADYLGD